MKIAIITEYVVVDGQYMLTDESLGLLNLMAEQGESPLVINWERQSLSNSELVVYDYTGEVELTIPVSSVAVAYVCLMAKKIPKYNYYKSFSDNISNCLNLLNFLQARGVMLINSFKAINYNLSKQYLLDFNDVACIPTKTLSSYDELLALQHDDNYYVIKPLIDERSKGTRVIDSKCDFDFESYYLSYVGQEIASHKQGLIVQPFVSNFLNAEVKVAVIDGEITCAKASKPDGFEQKIYSKADGNIVQVPYKLSSSEKAFVLHVYSQYCLQFDQIYYARIDFVYDESSQPVLSEIEVINPNFNVSANIFDKSVVDNHNQKIFDLLKRYRK